MLAVISVIFFIISFMLLNKRINIFSKNISVLGLIILLSVFIQILPGIVLVSFLGFPMSYGLQNSISDDVLYFTFWYTLLSLALLFLLLSIASYFINFNINFNDYCVRKRLAYALILISTVVIIIKVLSVGDIPLFQALSGQSELASIQKSKILRGEVGFGGFAIGYLFAYFHYIAFIYAYIARHRKVIGKGVFYGFAIIVAFYSIYSLEKYNFAFLIILVGFMHLSLNSFSYSRFLINVLLALSLLILAFVILQNSSMTDVFQQMFSRMFIGQMEGSYMIYEALEPDFDRVLYGAPLNFIFVSNLATDPSADVIRIFFPGASDAWVNSNSYILAHAWSIFGFSAVFIMPVVLAMNIIIYAVLRDVFKHYIGLLALIIYAVLILRLQINNDFSYYFYFRAIVSFAVIGIFCLVIVGMVKYISIRGKVI